MKKIKHPTIAGIERTVTNKELARWLKAGWVDAGVSTEEPVKNTSRSRTAARKKG